jgi:type I restriction enzyme M protein
MLDTETKRRIDNARNQLVGKVPDPKSQVEQITIALIYKFMDDMDAESEELGGKRKFFSGEFDRYSWKKLLAPDLGGFDVLTLYAEAIQKMNINPNIPQLFRDIFKNAYLPYRDPETLKSFLKIIDDFEYDHSERLGDAFEYLLSVLGSQGDAGQFRTPRHIIDFMVELVDPKKNETILDPACGTAGFLISSYKHIVKNNSSSYNPKKDNTNGNGSSYNGDKLTPDERKKLAVNIKGYDISPDMVRLSLVNLYLHGFANPLIIEYDTLTSEEKWNEFSDIILANPPFMSPKGGIKPHKRFSVESSRSEVLFVDYIAEHLTPNGRGAVIVPEGIIFQSGTAYKSLRKMLVEKYLYAVVSLPGGVFNPYSGVKTSILLMDKAIARRTDKILFAKIDNDGFDLGAQRRANDKGEIPYVINAIKKYVQCIINGTEFNVDDYTKIVITTKDNISVNDWNLSGERYRENISLISSNYNMVELGSIAEFKRGPFGSSIKRSVCIPKALNTYKVYEQGNIINNDFSRGEYYLSQNKFHELEQFELLPGDIAITCAGTLGRIAVAPFGIERGIINSVLLRIRINENLIDKEYFIRMFASTYLQDLITQKSTGVAINNLFATKVLKQFQIPLPPLKVQKEIVTKIEGWQKIIDGARQVVQNYKPQIQIDPSWPMIELEALCEIVRGSSPRPQGDPKYYGGDVPRLMVADITRDGMYTTPRIDFLTVEGAKKSRPMKKGEVILTVSGNPGLPTILATDSCIHDGLVGFRNLKAQLILTEFFYFCLLMLKDIHGNMSVGAVFRNLNTDQIRKFTIPLPEIEKQKIIVDEIKKEMDFIDTNKKLIDLFEKKIKDKIAGVWGE